MGEGSTKALGCGKRQWTGPNDFRRGARTQGMDEAPPTVEELAEYCQVQAGLLAGRAEHLRSEAAALLDAVDDDIETMRAELDAGVDTVDETVAPPSTDDPGAPNATTLAGLEADIGEARALVDTKRTRIDAFEGLAAAYTELAASVAGEPTAETALDRIVSFEADNDVPAYFEDRETIVERVATASDDRRTRD